LRDSSFAVSRCPRLRNQNHSIARRALAASRRHRLRAQTAPREVLTRSRSLTANVHTNTLSLVSCFTRSQSLATTAQPQPTSLRDVSLAASRLHRLCTQTKPREMSTRSRSLKANVQSNTPPFARFSLAASRRHRLRNQIYNERHPHRRSPRATKQSSGLSTRAVCATKLTMRGTLIVTRPERPNKAAG
jgi:hypothetical protein